jgi:sugar transferase EpsL
LYRYSLKRALDIGLSLIGIVVLAPVMLLAAVVVLADLGRPVLFRQSRPGKDGRPFRIFKFRTMRRERNAMESDEARLTAVGRLLREFSIDELPELFNVLKGDMSLVGPRPLLTRYLDRYTAEQARRHEVRPGVTGWAQIHGRNALGWDERFRLDVWYVDNHSLAVDCQILLRTVWTLFTRRGITQPGHATAEEFKGRMAQ